MKKIVLLLLALVLCVAVFASCNRDQKQPDDTTGKTDEVTKPADDPAEKELNSAVAYVQQLYKDMAEVTPADYKVVGVVNIGGKSYTVTWTVNVTAGNKDGVKVVVNDDKTVTIDVDERASEEIVYELTAEVKNDAGKSGSKTFKHKVPVYNVNTWEDYVRECGEKDDDSVVIIGYVTAINSATGSSGCGTMWVQDKDGHGYYVYCPTLTKEETATREALQKAYPVGTQVQVTGTVTTYNGCFEFNKGCTVEKTGKTAESENVTLVYTDATEDFGKAADNKDRATLDKYQSARVTLKGVTLTSVDGSYYYFTVNGVQYNLYRNNYFFEDAQIEELFKKFVAGTKVDITGVISVYSNQFQIYPDTVDSIKPSDVKLTDAEKVDVELKNATISALISSDCEITLPLKGTANEDVKLEWTVDDANVTYDAATGKCTIKVPDTAVTVKFTVKATCGSESQTKTVEVKLSKVATPIKDLIELGQKQESYTTEKYIATGVVTELQSEKYGNMLIRDTEGNTILVYGLYDADGKRYDAMTDKPVVGDLVTVVGVVGQYKGTAQFKNATLMSFVKPTTVEKALEIGGKFEKNKYSEEKYLVTGVIKEVQSEKYGNVLITDANGKELLVYGLYSCDGAVRYDAMAKKPVAGDTITVLGILGKYNDPQMKNGWLVAHDAASQGGDNPDNPENPDDKAAATLSFAVVDGVRTSADANKQVWAQNGITFTNEKGQSTTDINPNYSNPVRCYKSSTVKVEFTGMVKIVFECNSADYAATLVKCIGASATADGNKVTVTLSAAANSFEAVLTEGQVRINSISVYTA